MYDHRHERPGYIRPTIVRVHRLDAASAPELAAVVRFLRDANGSESLGIGYAALSLRAAPAGADTERDPGGDRDDGGPAGAARVGAARGRRATRR